MYYLLSFKLLRRKQGVHNVSQHKTKSDTEFIGFSEFLRSLPADKKIAVCLNYFDENNDSICNL